MGHTNSTANLSLPQFIGTDKPTWLGDVNGAFSAIDSYAGTNDAAVSAAASDASSAISQAAAAVNTANTANTTAGNASTAATAAVTAANQANALSNQVALRTGVLADLHTTDRTSIVNAINEVKDAEGDLSSLTTTDKTSLVAAINEVAGSGSGHVLLHTEASDGTKTYKQILDAFATYVASIGDDGYIEIVTATDKMIRRFERSSSGIYFFVYSIISGTAFNFYADKIDVNTTNSGESFFNGTTVTDNSGTAVPSGYTFNLYS